ncbi:hypothetical protein JHK87_053378 [Glycine soja]|nr:hypothetical protein JHK87_053378 [Glycine soja]
MRGSMTQQSSALRATHGSRDSPRVHRTGSSSARGSRSTSTRDGDSNGAIDQEELKKCFNKLEISFSEEGINDLFEACDIKEDMRMKFNEFIVDPPILWTMWGGDRLKK